MIHELTPTALAARLALAGILLLATGGSASDRRPGGAPAATGTSGAPAGESSGAGCRAPVVADPARAEPAGLATVERSPGGTWRRNLRYEDPVLRIPMSGAGTVVSPAGPAPRRDSDRWVDGYRPSTPGAQAAYARWLKEHRTRDAGGLAVARSNQLPAPQFNMLNPGMVRRPDTPPSDYVVRHDVAEASVVDVKRLNPGVATPKEPSTSSVHHRTGLLYEQYRRIKERVARRAETPLVQDADRTAVTRAPGPLIASFDAIPSQGGVPPDPIMAAGLDHIVVAVNSHYQVFDKSGTAVTPVIAMDAFFSGVPQCIGTFDPFIDYDEEFDRWVMGMDDYAGADSHLCIAASQTGDPTGSWNVYSFRSDAVATATRADFPQMAIGLEAVYISANMFIDTPPGTFFQTRMYAVDKAALYAGAAISVAEASFGPNFTVQPAKIRGFLSGGWPAPGTPHYFVAHDFATPSSLTTVWRWSDPLHQAPELWGGVLASFLDPPPDAPELGGGTPNDTGIGDYLDAEYRDGHVYATRAVGCNLGAGGAEACIDWHKIDVRGLAPRLVEQQLNGAFGSADEFRYYPDIAVDRANNIALGYTKSGPGLFTELHVTGREVGDPPGQLQAETLQVMGTGNYVDGQGCGDGSCDRWGDYSAMTTDPDGCTLWYVGEYSNGGTGLWETNVGAYKFPSCSVDSLINLNKSTFHCGDQVTVAVSDSIALTEAEVSAQTVVTSSSGDSETVPVGKWTGSGCTGNACTEWTTQLPTSGDPASTDDGKVNVADGGSFSVDYTDLHGGHANQSRTVGVSCRTRFDDAGYLVDGGCENRTGTELYRDYFDAGELIAYTAAFFNPPAAPALTDVVANLSISGPAAGMITIYNPSVQVGPIGQGQVGGAIFHLAVDPGVDTAALRLSAHDFDLGLTSVADGFIVPQVLTQQQFVQADDVIVSASQCYNFESGDEGFLSEVYVDSYTCGFAEGCVPTRVVNTVAAPWTWGIGCGGETRTDQPDSTCDAGGSAAFKTNANLFSCGDFAESSSTVMDDVLYSPTFGPGQTGSAGNGQPWFYSWRHAEWFYRSEHQDGFGSPTTLWGHFWDDDYQGVTDPAENEIDDYPFFFGFFAYGNQDWDSATPWDPMDLPANYDAVAFPSTASGAATAGLQWRWAYENFDADRGGNPQATVPALGTAVDNMQLFYDQYHATGQIGVCGAAVGTASFDRFHHAGCPAGELGVAVLDSNAGGAVTVSVTSDGTGDSETVTIAAAGPNYESSLPYSTSGGTAVDDGTLFVTPEDTVRIRYDDADPAGTATQTTFIDCAGGAVVVEGVAGLQDDGTGDGDTHADQNEIIDLSLRIRNDTANDLTDVRVVIDSDDPTIGCILEAAADFGTIPGNGGSASNSLATDPFRFVVSDSAQCTDPENPPTATFHVFITADGLFGTDEPQTVTLRLDLNDLGSTVILDENFDAAEPAGWTHQAGAGDDDGVGAGGAAGLACTPYGDNWFWRASGGNTGGGFFCWNDPLDDFPDGTYDDLLDAELISPPLVLPAGRTEVNLSFDHEYEFAATSTLRLDGAVVQYRVNAGAWQKIETLPYDGPLILNTYCNPLCNGGAALFEADPPATIACATETAGSGENVFCRLGGQAQGWTGNSATIRGLDPGDQIEFRWRVGSMNTAALGGDTTGGYGLDNVRVLANAQECDTAIRPETGCGVTFDSAGALVELCGDGDANVEPGEEWGLGVSLVNEGGDSAVHTFADLTVGAGGVQAAVVSNPGSFGTIAAGAKRTQAYSFLVDSGSACNGDVVFGVTNIVDEATSHADVPAAFAVPVGTVAAAETGFQGTDPLDSSGAVAGSILSPLFSLPSADTGLLSYDFEAVPAAAGDWNANARVYLWDGSAQTIVKDFGVADANPYDVSSLYTGPGQYEVRLEARNGETFRMTHAVVSIEELDCGVSACVPGGAAPPLADGSFGTGIRLAKGAGAGEIDVTFDAAVCSDDHAIVVYGDLGDFGGYRGEVDAGCNLGASGSATFTHAGDDVWFNVLWVTVDDKAGHPGYDGNAWIRPWNAVGLCGTVFDDQSDAGATCASGAAAPPLGDDVVGTGIRLAKGPGAGEVDITYDAATCSGDHAIVLYGDLGDFSGYQGAVDAGCNLGASGSATFTHAGNHVWFNVIWVTNDDRAGHPGYDGGDSIRSWNAAGLCGAATDDPSDGVCD